MFQQVKKEEYTMAGGYTSLQPIKGTLVYLINKVLTKYKEIPKRERRYSV